MKLIQKLSKLQIANLLAAIVIVVVPFHAFLTVWASSFVGHFTLLRLWDEFILTILVVLAFILVVKDKKLRVQLYNNTLIRLITAYLALSLVLSLYGLVITHSVSLKACAYGLAINLRYFIWFICVYLMSQQSSWLKRNWQKLILLPLAVVIVFGLLQFFILPNNFLIHFGYGGNTYVPFVTINQNTATIRIQSFLRGANPLGAYLAVMTSLVTCLVAFTRKSIYLWLLLGSSLLALFLSFSRSGWIAAFIAIMISIALRLRSKKQQLAGVAVFLAVITILSTSYFLLRHNTSVQDAVLHVSSHSTAKVTSNQGHFATLKQSLNAISRQPLGEGAGSAGQASWYNSGHPIRNTESYFLQVGEEVGWFGLALFLAIIIKTGYELWRRRDDKLAFGLLCSLFGLVFIMQLSYAWSDDTLAFIWWGLAGIALGSSSPTKIKQKLVT